VTNEQSAAPVAAHVGRCADCGADGGVERIDMHERVVVTICNGCSDRRAVRCPLCGNPFGREVKRASRCKNCGETVARNGQTPVLASRLSTQSMCDALRAFEPISISPDGGAWLRGCLRVCVLHAAQAGRDSRSINSAFAAALRTNFEKGLSRERLSSFGFAFARAIWICGGNPRPIQRTLHQLELEDLRATGMVDSVGVLPAGDCCENCGKLSGRLWSIDAALAESPLPCSNCLEENEGGFGWCRCEYQTEFDSEMEDIARRIRESGDIEREARRINIEAGTVKP